MRRDPLGGLAAWKWDNGGGAVSGKILNRILNMTIRVLVAEDHHLIRQGIVKLIGGDAFFEVVAEAENGLQALNKIRSLKPDVAVLDINMPHLSGLDVAKKALEENLSAKLVILTIYDDEEFLMEALETGVHGYVLKENTAQELITAINYAASGKSYISPLVSHYLAPQNRQRQFLVNGKRSIMNLTPTELKILRLISEKKTSREIATELFISHRTVQNHRNHICGKLGLKGANALLHFAIENKRSF